MHSKKKETLVCKCKIERTTSASRQHKPRDTVINVNNLRPLVVSGLDSLHLDSSIYNDDEANMQLGTLENKREAVNNKSQLMQLGIFRRKKAHASRNKSEAANKGDHLEIAGNGKYEQTGDSINVLKLYILCFLIY